MLLSSKASSRVDRSRLRHRLGATDLCSIKSSFLQRVDMSVSRLGQMICDQVAFLALQIDESSKAFSVVLSAGKESSVITGLH